MKRPLTLLAAAVSSFFSLLLVLTSIGTAANVSDDSTLSLQVDYAHEWVGGMITPGATVVLTLTGTGGGLKDRATVIVDGAGKFQTDCTDWDSQQCPEIEVGDTVTADALGISGTVGPLGSIEGVMNTATDIVSGTLNVPGETEPLEVLCQQWIDGNVNATISIMLYPDNNPFICDFAFVDLEPSHQVQLSYFEPDGDEVINYASTQIEEEEIHIFLPLVMKP